MLRAVFEAVQDGGVAWPPQIFQQYPTKITSLARAYSSVDSLFAAVPLMVVIAMSRGASGLCARVALERHRKQSLVMRTMGLSENAQRLAWPPRIRSCKESRRFAVLTAASKRTARAAGA